ERAGLSYMSISDSLYTKGDRPWFEEHLSDVRNLSILGIQFVEGRYQVTGSCNAFRFEVPMYVPISLGLIFPYKYWRFRRTVLKRTECGLCAFCGYDLRESKNRCPECGAAFRLADDVNVHE